MVSFTQAVKNSLTYCKHFDFQGRSCRSEFWWFQLCQCLIYFVINFIGFCISRVRGGETMVIIIVGIISLLSLIVLVLLFYAHILMIIRRLHDRNMRGWWYLINFIPGGILVFLVLLCLKGTTGPNRFGPDPLGEMQPIDTNPYPRQPNLDNPNCQPVPKQYEAPAQSMDQPIQQGQQFGNGAPPSKGKKKSLLPQLLLVFGGLLASVVISMFLIPVFLEVTGSWFDWSFKNMSRRSAPASPATPYSEQDCKLLHDIFAYRNLGEIYATGQGVPLDYAKAAEYFAKGCELQDGLACKVMGELYFEGKGVPQDYTKAAAYSAKGCELQNGSACGGLGTLYAMAMAFLWTTLVQPNTTPKAVNFRLAMLVEI